MAQTTPFIPAQAGIQQFVEENWMPACAGTNGDGVAPVTSGDKISLDAP